MKHSLSSGILIFGLFGAGISHAYQIVSDDPVRHITQVAEATLAGRYAEPKRFRGEPIPELVAQVANTEYSAPLKGINETPSDMRAQVTRSKLPQTEVAQDIPVPEKAAKTGQMKPAAPDRGVPDDYIIGEGDVLNISVWREPDASVPSVVVRPDGRISMPMLKEVRVSGLTTGQAEKLITADLGKFISTADVTVIVVAINSKKVYFVGGVKKEGPIPYTYRMTILQALSEAGGLTDYAKKKKIYVLRHTGGRDYRVPFNYNAAVKGDAGQLNAGLQPGDTIVVPR